MFGEKKTWIIILIIFIIGTAFQVYQKKSTPFESKWAQVPPVAQKRQHSQKNLTVHIAGHIKTPGVYQMPPSSRVLDLIKKAGGALNSTDLDQINLAAPLKEGQKITLKKRKAKKKSPIPSPIQKIININTAPQKQLCQLKGIGPNLAQKIIQYRKKTKFTSIDEIKKIKGISEKKFKKLEKHIKI